MKLSLNWLQSYINEPLDVEMVLERLTMAGIELESIEEFSPEVDSQDANITDKIVEFKITPNRGDCLSVYGIAREIIALTDYTLKPQVEYKVNPTCADQLTVNVLENNLCPNYVGMIIKNVDNTTATPPFILERLKQSNLRSISAIVDIANYVMLSIGQPLHSFDMNVVGANLTVRLAQNNEELIALDSSELKLSNNTLVIADSTNKVAAIAGVMGAMNTGTTINTTSIVLESAFFIPEIISGKTKLYGVNSDAAYRFERGVDPQLQLKAINYAAHLIQKYCGGECSAPTQISNNTTQMHTAIEISYAKINELAGHEFGTCEIDSILNKLGFIVKPSKDVDLSVVSPSYRFDIKIKEDIVEEVIRCYGYDNIEAIMPQLTQRINSLDSNLQHINTIKNKMCVLGFNEIIAYAFQEESVEKLIGNKTHKNVVPVQLQNSIANWGVMRTSLIGDLLKSYASNVKYGHKSVKLFEVANVFYGEDDCSQPLKIAGLMGGDFAPLSWGNQRRDVDFFDIKQVVESLLSNLANVEFRSCNDNPVFHSGRCANVYVDELHVGVVGQLNPRLSGDFNVDATPYLFELDVFGIKPENHVTIDTLNKLPKLSRDLAFILDDNVQAFDVIKNIKNANVSNLLDIIIFDVYTGDKLPVGKKSLGVKFIMQGMNNTLTEEEINVGLNIIQNIVEQGFGATLR